MTFANPWGLLALLALPAIVVIHMYHRRFPPLVVAGAHLWTSLTRQNLEGRKREKLPITPSLILELLAALLLALVLSQPHLASLDKAVHFVAVLDNSASMMARPPGGDAPSFRDAALAELEERAGRLPRGSVVTIVLTGIRPETVGGSGIPWTEAKAKLASWRPHAPRHSFEPAWDQALQTGDETGLVLFFSDHLPAAKDTPDRLECVSVGRRLYNVAISAARWTFDSAAGKGKVFLRVQNHSRKPIDFEVRGRRGEQVVFRRAASLAEQGASAFEADVPGGLGQLVIELSAEGDGLAADNVVHLIEPQVRTVHVSVAHPQAETVRLVRKVFDVLPDVQPADSEAADLVVSSAESLPESNPRRWWAGIGPVSREEEAAKGAKDLAGPYLLEKRDPLLDGVLLAGVVWGGVQPVELDVTPLVSSGRQMLLSRLSGTRTVGFLFNIDLERSNLGESPDWPILLTNLVESRRQNLPGLQRWNYRLGEEVRFRLYEGDVDPEGTTTPALTLLHDGELKKTIARTSEIELPYLDDTGVYEIKSGESLVGRFAMNLHDAEESDLRNLTPGRREAKAEAAPSIVALDDPYQWLLALGLVLIVAALLFDWFVLRPKH